MRGFDWKVLADPAKRSALWMSLLNNGIAAAKWFLEFVRNLVVVAVFLWFAERSDLWYLQAIAYSAFAALVFHAAATVTVLIYDRPSMHQPVARPIVFLLAVGSGALLALVFIGGFPTLADVIAEIVRLQVR